jgi:hypothetical protein
VAASVAATALRLREVEAEQGGHRALADRHGLLHRLAASAQQPRGVRQADRARRAASAEYSRASAGDEFRRRGQIELLGRARARASREARPPSTPAARSRRA